MSDYPHITYVHFLGHWGKDEDDTFEVSGFSVESAYLNLVKLVEERGKKEQVEK